MQFDIWYNTKESDSIKIIIYKFTSNELTPSIQ